MIYWFQKEITAVDLTEETLNRIQDTEETTRFFLSQLVKKKSNGISQSD